MRARYLVEADSRSGGYIVCDSYSRFAVVYRSNNWTAATVKCRMLNRSEQDERERLMVSNYVAEGLGEI